MENKKSFTEIVEALKIFSDEEQIKATDKVMKAFSDSSFDDRLMAELSGPTNTEETYSEIVDSHITALRLLDIKQFNTFCFSDYSDCRTLIVDGTVYDLDNEFSKSNKEAVELLHAIDSLIADIDEGNLQNKLKKVESIINAQANK